MVYENHGVRVTRVEPSIDHRIFYPDLRRKSSRLTITAMLRPKTPRRAPRRTIRIMEVLAAQLGDKANLQVFGADQADLNAFGLEVPAGVKNLGRLRQDEVPNVNRSTDLFLDLSDFQAFGRTGLEAMACGCVPLVPLLGGSAEYAAHGRNAFVVDTRSDAAIVEAVQVFLQMTPEAHAGMRQNALETATRYSIRGAALSELRLFAALTNTRA
jgi:glycosyltransferase involved in cell wall biosynthesis